MEAQIVLRTLLSRLPDLRLAAITPERTKGINRPLKSLIIEFST